MSARVALAVFGMASTLLSCLSGMSQAWQAVDPAATPPSASVPVTGHYLFRGPRLLSLDLQHGAGLAQIAVTRTWTGRDALPSGFGPGWSDENLVRLRLINPSTVVVFRGGSAWRMAHSAGDNFSTTSGEVVRRHGEGWRLEAAGGSHLEFDAQGRLLAEVVAGGQRTTYAYDDQGRLLSLEDNPQNFLRYQYTPQHDHVAAIEGPEKLKVEYRYDALGRLASVTNAHGIRVDYEYDAAGTLVAARDQFGNSMSIPQPTPWLDTQEPAPGQEPAADDGSADDAEPQAIGPRPQVVRDEHGRIIEEHRGGWLTKLAYDARGRIIERHTPWGVQRLAYDAFDRVESITHPDGRATRFQYNQHDSPSKVTLPDGSTVVTLHDAHGRPTHVESSRGDWQATAYDAAGRVSSIKRSPDSFERYEYDALGRIAKITYSTGREVRREYDADGRLAKTSSSTGEETQYQSADDGQTSEMRRPSGLTIREGYDERGRVAWREDDVHGRIEFGYQGDEEAPVRIERKGLGVARRLIDCEGLVRASTDARNRTKQYRYNERQQTVAVTSPMARTWNYQYDPAGRLAAIELPGGLTHRLSYDDGGRVARIERGGLVWRDFLFDQQGRLRMENTPNGLAAAYSYDAAGRTREVVLPSGRVALGYTKTGLLESIVGPDYQLRQEFHGDGRLARRTYEPARLDLKLPLDKQGRSAGVELNGLAVRYEYNARGRLEKLVLPGGTVIALTSDVADRPQVLMLGDALTIALEHNASDQLTSITATSRKGPTVLRERYAYDSVGNLLRLDGDTSTTTQLEYDRDDRLVAVRTGVDETRYEYDVNDNLRTAGMGGDVTRWELDARGQPVHSSQGVWYTWDAMGNLTGATSPRSSLLNTFDAAGRLVERQVDRFRWRYGYLPGGDRLWQQSFEGKAWYAYTAEGLVGWRDEKKVAWLLVTLPGSNHPVAMCNEKGTTLFVVADRLGSIRRVVDSTGAVVARCDYGAYGEPAGSDGRSPLDMYAGMVVDTSGLHYARRRYYDTSLRRFISVDPELGDEDVPASHNAYAYAAGNPLAYVDTLGSAPHRINPMSPLDVNRPDWNLPHPKAPIPRDVQGYFNPVEGIRVAPHPSLADDARLAGVLEHEFQHWAQWQMEMQRRGYDASKIPLRAQRTLYGQWINSLGADGRPIRAALERGSVWQQVHHLVRDQGLSPNDPRVKEALNYLRSNGYATSAELAKIQRSINRFAKPGPLMRALQAGGRLLARGLRLGMEIFKPTPVGVVMEAVAITTEEKAEEATARGDANEAEEQNRQQFEDLVNTVLREVATDPDRLIPRNPDGTPIDLNDPEQVLRLINMIRRNLQNNQRPFDGIIQRPGQNVNRNTRGYDDALERAKRMVAEGERIKEGARRNLDQATTNEARAKGKLDNVMNEAQIYRDAQRFFPPPTFDDLARKQAEVQSTLDQLNKERQEALARSEKGKQYVDAAQQAAETICGLASQSGKGGAPTAPGGGPAFSTDGPLTGNIGGGGPSNDDIAQRKKEAQKLLDDLESQRRALDPGPNSQTADQLRQQLNEMNEMRGRLEGQVNTRNQVNQSVGEANDMLREAGRQRQPLQGIQNQLRSTSNDVDALLQPYNWMDEAVAVMNQGRNLPQGFTDPPDLDPLMSDAREFQEQINRDVPPGAEDQLKQAEDLAGKAQEAVGGGENGDKPLAPMDPAHEKALACASQIQLSGILAPDQALGEFQQVDTQVAALPPQAFAAPASPTPPAAPPALPSPSPAPAAAPPAATVAAPAPDFDRQLAAATAAWQPPAPQTQGHIAPPIEQQVAAYRPRANQLDQQLTRHQQEVYNAELARQRQQQQYEAQQQQQRYQQQQQQQRQYARQYPVQRQYGGRDINWGAAAAQGIRLYNSIRALSGGHGH